MQFSDEKQLKLQPKMTKIANFTKFSRFYATFVNFSRDFMDQTVENIQQRINSFPSTVVHGDKCSFVRKNCHNDPKTFKIFLRTSIF